MKRPKLEDYEDYEDFLAAAYEWSEDNIPYSDKTTYEILGSLVYLFGPQAGEIRAAEHDIIYFEVPDGLTEVQTYYLLELGLMVEDGNWAKFV